MILNKFIGDKAFYKKVLALAVPIMVQNGITNIVNMVDNVMVGSMGTEQMSGVAIVNQILFVFNLCIFGGLAGIGIFTAQYYGRGDHTGLRYTFRLKLYMGAFILACALFLFGFFGDNLISSFLHESDSTADLKQTFNYAKDYLAIMVIGLIPFTVTNVYSSTLRETEKPIIPMLSGFAAVFINVVFNYLLIFGKFGFPELGVKGAAIATVMSRFVECLIIVIIAHGKKKEFAYLKGVYRSLYVPLDVAKRVIAKATPLLVNEAFWSAGTALLTRCYSLRGLDVVAAANITSTITNIFLIATIAFGNAIAIMAGGLLGAGEVKRAKDTSTKLIAFSFMVCAGLSVLLLLTCQVFPKAFNTSPLSHKIAESFLRCFALFLPIASLNNTFYFTLRSGGKTFITFLFDSVYMIAVCVPFTFILAEFTTLPIQVIYAGSIWIEIFKAFLGFYLVKKGTWANNLVNDSSVKA